jgi:hypothetical protein
MNVYGKLDSEREADENLVCRQVVSEIMNFGVTQRQIWYIIYLLGMHLEDVDEMREVVGFVKETKGTELFLSSELVSGGQNG